MEREIARCESHADRPAVAECVVCGRRVCGECARVVGGRYYCPADTPAEAEPVVSRSGRPWRWAYLLAAAALVAAAYGVLLSLAPLAREAARVYQRETDRYRLLAVADALDSFKRDVGRYPTQEEHLRALVSEPPGTGNRWLGPYIGKPYVAGGELVDGAGRPLKYSAAAGRHVLSCVGPDGKSGTADDLELILEERAVRRRKGPLNLLDL